jgi:hypothetical protein
MAVLLPTAVSDPEGPFPSTSPPSLSLSLSLSTASQSVIYCLTLLFNLDSGAKTSPHEDQ